MYQSLLMALDAGGIAAIIIVLVLLLAVSFLVMCAMRYKKCPPNKILVIYGKIGNNKDGTNRSSKCIHGGAGMVWPLVQAYSYLDLTPISISVDLKNALSRQNIRIDVPSRFTVGISTEPGIMQNAAERLRTLQLNEIKEMAQDIIFGQLRLVVATMNIEEINTDRDKFLTAIARNVEEELKKIGLKLINVNMTDISDESGYIIALGKEAAAKAINDAKISVAEADRTGSIGQAQAQRDQRINVAIAESKAIQGENQAKAEIAAAESELRERQAEALKRATASEKIQSAKALQEAYAAEQEAEAARFAKEKATQEADIIVKTEIEKRQKELEAEADAEQMRRRAKGEAEAIYAKMEAEARGIKDILTAQASGIASIVNAAQGDTQAAVKLMIADKIENLVATQVEAIKNIKIDKVTVWDGGTNQDGKTATSNFMSGMLKSLPPLEELFSMAGLNIPNIVRPTKIDTKDAKIDDNEIKIDKTKAIDAKDAMPAKTTKDKK